MLRVNADSFSYHLTCQILFGPHETYAKQPWSSLTVAPASSCNLTDISSSKPGNTIMLTIQETSMSSTAGRNGNIQYHSKICEQ